MCFAIRSNFFTLSVALCPIPMCSRGQRKRLYQALASQMILISRINELLVLVFSFYFICKHHGDDVYMFSFVTGQ